MNTKQAFPHQSLESFPGESFNMKGKILGFQNLYKIPRVLSSRTPLDRRHSIFIVSPRRKCYFVYFDIGTRSTTSKIKLFTKTVSEPMKMELFVKVVNR